MASGLWLVVAAACAVTARAFISAPHNALLTTTSSSFATSANRCVINRQHSCYAAAPLSMVVATQEVTMPALSSTMTEGKIVAWLKNVGDKVSAGEAVMVVESDKADMDVECFEEGYLAKILVGEGEAAKVGSACAILVSSPEDIANVGDVAPSGGGAPAPAPPAAQAAPAAGGAAPKCDVDFKEITMPALSSTMTEGKVVEWLKNVGDQVGVGDAVLVVESDKADMDVESFEEGFLAVTLTPAGEACKVGSPIGLLATKVEDIAAVEAYGNALAGSGGGGGSAPPAAAAAAPPASAPVSAPATPASPPAIVNDGRVVATGYAKQLSEQLGIDLRTIQGTDEGGRISATDVQKAAAGGGGGAAAPKASTWVPAPGVIAATPRARALAKSKGLDVKTVKGTGNFGRVTEDDVLTALGQAPKKPVPVAAASGPALTSGREIPVLPDGPKNMDGMQKAVVKNMEATMNVPIFRVSRKIRTDAFDDLYRQLKPRGITVSAMLAKAVALVLESHPIMNAKYATNQIVYQKNINVAMAVAIEGGLITPTLKNANEMSLLALGARWKELVGKAKAKTLTPDEYQSGTFTITNLGMFGVSDFAAILPSGTGTILAIGGSLPTVVAKADGSGFGVVKEMTVSVTCDHRHIYGADAAEFLKSLADLMENNPAQLLL